jgi:acetyl-CoA synthetase
MDGLTGESQYNAGHVCTGLQCIGGKAGKTALTLISTAGEKALYTFQDMEDDTNRFANVLSGLGLKAGDVFFTFLPRCYEQYVSFLGALKMQAVSGTLFSNFGPDAILDRLGDSGARGVITKKSFLKKFRNIRHLLPRLQFILVTDITEHLEKDVLSYPRLMGEASSRFDVPATSPGTPSVLHYTSGSTGKPKGVLHVHGGVVLHNRTTREVLGVKEQDKYWCTADMGWVTGTSYGVIGPWSMGATQVQFEGGYNAQRWMKILEEEQIDVWYTAPTVLRMLMQEDPEIFLGLGLERLRHISSVGEPLNPEIIAWGRKILGKEIYDTYFQTETGAIMISNRPGLPVRPGSMGKPIDGMDARIIADDGEVIRDNRGGNLCLKAGWESMFATYLNNQDVYQKKFRDGYYYTGDRAYADRDGYFWFLSRTDDVINTAGHLISPFEIESALLEIPQVAEAAVIGAPDRILFEKVVAFVKLARDAEKSPGQELSIRLYITNKVSSIATPQEIIFVDEIPKNKSGKIMRRVIRAQYLGLDPGDISTLEDY